MSSEQRQRTVSRLRWAAVALVYVAGVAWRAYHISFHDPRTSVYSDMALYVSISKRLATEGYKLIPFDVLHPPGMSVMFSKFIASDPELGSLVILQFVVSSLTPLAVGAMAWAAFDRLTAAWALAITSFGYFYVEYASFFLAEIYMMFLVPLTLALYITAVKSKKPWQVALIGCVAGVSFFVALAFKMVALAALPGFAIVHWLFTRGSSRRYKTIALVALFVGAAPGMFAMAARCTDANKGEFCFGSSKGSSDFLLGHYGRIHSLNWTDATFGSPAAQQHGYEDKPKVGFSIMDSKANSDAAWDWVGRNELPALVLSVQHVFDMLSSNAPWPVIWTPEWPRAQGYQYLFVIFIMFPALMVFVDLARAHGFRGMLRSYEFALFSTLFGLFAAVFIATGEPRYRLPFDCVFIVLAVRFYIRVTTRIVPSYRWT
jgi:hypothetical protein